MSIADMFSQFIANLAISNTEKIGLRYGELTAALNKEFRDTESKTAEGGVKSLLDSCCVVK